MVALAVTSNWIDRGFMFNEMTGVLGKYRRKGIAISVKLLGIKYALVLGAKVIYTSRDFENHHAIRLNRKLGFVDTDWESLR